MISKYAEVDRHVIATKMKVEDFHYVFEKLKRIVLDASSYQLQNGEFITI